MYYMLYISTAAKPMNYDELTALLNQCRENNRQRNITGMLLYQHETFMQMLEGEKQEVLDVFETIKNDSRHTGIHIVHTGDIDQRNFKDWSMGFFNMDRAGEFPEYKDFITEKISLKSFREDSKQAYDFMTLFTLITPESFM